MFSGRARCKAKMLLAAVFTLWSTFATAGVNEDLIQASMRGDLPAVKRFISKGADVNSRTPKGITALSIATKEGHKDVAEVLRKARAKE
jgi:hypothetical protein